MNTERFNSLQGLEYSGKLEAKQFANESIVNYEKLTKVQTELYKRCLMGMDYYDKESAYSMNSSKKLKIVKKQKDVQRLMNTWKQELTNKITNSWLTALFPKSNEIKMLAANVFTSESFVNTLSFKELGIKKTDVITKLMAENFLPKNFASL